MRITSACSIYEDEGSPLSFPPPFINAFICIYNPPARPTEWMEGEVKQNVELEGNENRKTNIYFFEKGQGIPNA